MKDDVIIGVQYFRPVAAIAPYVTSLYCFTITAPPGETVADCLHPEWASLRFMASGELVRAKLAGKAPRVCWPFSGVGPTSKCVHVEIGTSQLWGFGLRPLGWASCMEEPAAKFTDRIFDGDQCDSFDRFAPIMQIVQSFGGNRAGCAQAIQTYLANLNWQPPADADRILACHNALQEAEIATVAALCERVDVSRRTLERLCARYFGYSPKQLLRRQRFLRSLARYTLERHGNWSTSLDSQYFDQAHFVKDFRSFMGMTPSEYAALEHPILDRIIGQRLADLDVGTVGQVAGIKRCGGRR